MVLQGQESSQRNWEGCMSRLCFRAGVVLQVVQSQAFLKLA